MFEGKLVDLLNTHLGAWVELDASQIEVGLWNGHVTLRDVALKQSALAALSMPGMRLLGVRVGRCEIKVHYLNLRHTHSTGAVPLEVHISDVRVVVRAVRAEEPAPAFAAAAVPAGDGRSAAAARGGSNHDDDGGSDSGDGGDTAAAAAHASGDEDEDEEDASAASEAAAPSTAAALLADLKQHALDHLRLCIDRVHVAVVQAEPPSVPPRRGRASQPHVACMVGVLVRQLQLAAVDGPDSLPTVVAMAASGGHDSDSHAEEMAAITDTSAVASAFSYKRIAVRGFGVYVAATPDATATALAAIPLVDVDPRDDDGYSSGESTLADEDSMLCASVLGALAMVRRRLLESECRTPPPPAAAARADARAGPFAPLIQRAAFALAPCSLIVSMRWCRIRNAHNTRIPTFAISVVVGGDRISRFAIAVDAARAAAGEGEDVDDDGDDDVDDGVYAGGNEHRSIAASALADELNDSTLARRSLALRMRLDHAAVVRMLLAHHERVAARALPATLPVQEVTAAATRTPRRPSRGGSRGSASTAPSPAAAAERLRASASSPALDRHLDSPAPRSTAGRATADGVRATPLSYVAPAVGALRSWAGRLWYGSDGDGDDGASEAARDDDDIASVASAASTSDWEAPPGTPPPPLLELSLRVGRVSVSLLSAPPVAAPPPPPLVVAIARGLHIEALRSGPTISVELSLAYAGVRDPRAPPLSSVAWLMYPRLADNDDSEAGAGADGPSHDSSDVGDDISAGDTDDDDDDTLLPIRAHHARECRRGLRSSGIAPPVCSAAVARRLGGANTDDASEAAADAEPFLEVSVAVCLGEASASASSAVSSPSLDGTNDDDDDEPPVAGTTVQSSDAGPEGSRTIEAWVALRPLSVVYSGAFVRRLGVAAVAFGSAPLSPRGAPSAFTSSPSDDTSATVAALALRVDVQVQAPALYALPEFEGETETAAGLLPCPFPFAVRSRANDPRQSRAADCRACIIVMEAEHIGAALRTRTSAALAASVGDTDSDRSAVASSASSGRATPADSGSDVGDNTRRSRHDRGHARRGGSPQAARNEAAADVPGLDAAALTIDEFRVRLFTAHPSVRNCAHEMALLDPCSLHTRAVRESEAARWRVDTAITAVRLLVSPRRAAAALEFVRAFVSSLHWTARPGPPAQPRSQERRPSGPTASLLPFSLLPAPPAAMVSAETRLAEVSVRVAGVSVAVLASARRVAAFEAAAAGGADSTGGAQNTGREDDEEREDAEVEDDEEGGGDGTMRGADARQAEHDCEVAVGHVSLHSLRLEWAVRRGDCAARVALGGIRLASLVRTENAGRFGGPSDGLSVLSAGDTGAVPTDSDDTESEEEIDVTTVQPAPGGNDTPFVAVSYYERAEASSPALISSADMASNGASGAPLVGLPLLMRMPPAVAAAALPRRSAHVTVSGAVRVTLPAPDACARRLGLSLILDVGAALTATVASATAASASPMPVAANGTSLPLGSHASVEEEALRVEAPFEYAAGAGVTFAAPAPDNNLRGAQLRRFGGRLRRSQSAVALSSGDGAAAPPLERGRSLSLVSRRRRLTGERVAAVVASGSAATAAHELATARFRAVELAALRHRTAVALALDAIEAARLHIERIPQRASSAGADGADNAADTVDDEDDGDDAAETDRTVQVGARINRLRVLVGVARTVSAGDREEAALQLCVIGGDVRVRQQLLPDGATSGSGRLTCVSKVDDLRVRARSAAVAGHRRCPAVPVLVAGRRPGAAGAPLFRLRYRSAINEGGAAASVRVHGLQAVAVPDVVTTVTDLVAAAARPLISLRPRALSVPAPVPAVAVPSTPGQLLAVNMQLSDALVLLPHFPGSSSVSAGSSAPSTSARRRRTGGSGDDAAEYLAVEVGSLALCRAFVESDSPLPLRAEVPLDLLCAAPPPLPLSFSYRFVPAAAPVRVACRLLVSGAGGVRVSLGVERLAAVTCAGGEPTAAALIEAAVAWVGSPPPLCLAAGAAAVPDLFDQAPSLAAVAAVGGDSTVDRLSTMYLSPAAAAVAAARGGSGAPPPPSPIPSLRVLTSLSIPQPLDVPPELIGRETASRRDSASFEGATRVFSADAAGYAAEVDAGGNADDGDGDDPSCAWARVTSPVDNVLFPSALGGRLPRRHFPLAEQRVSAHLRSVRHVYGLPGREFAAIADAEAGDASDAGTPALFACMVEGSHRLLQETRAQVSVRTPLPLPLPQQAPSVALDDATAVAELAARMLLPRELPASFTSVSMPTAHLCVSPQSLAFLLSVMTGGGSASPAEAPAAGSPPASARRTRPGAATPRTAATVGNAATPSGTADATGSAPTASSTIPSIFAACVPLSLAPPGGEKTRRSPLRQADNSETYVTSVANVSVGQLVLDFLSVRLSPASTTAPSSGANVATGDGTSSAAKTETEESPVVALTRRRRLSFGLRRGGMTARRRGGGDTEARTFLLRAAAASAVEASPSIRRRAHTRAGGTSAASGDVGPTEAHPSHMHVVSPVLRLVAGGVDISTRSAVLPRHSSWMRVTVARLSAEDTRADCHPLARHVLGGHHARASPPPPSANTIDPSVAAEASAPRMTRAASIISPHAPLVASPSYPHPFGSAPGTAGPLPVFLSVSHPSSRSPSPAPVPLGRAGMVAASASSDLVSPSSSAAAIAAATAAAAAATKASYKYSSPIVTSPRLADVPVHYTSPLPPLPVAAGDGASPLARMAVLPRLTVVRAADVVTRMSHVAPIHDDSVDNGASAVDSVRAAPVLTARHWRSRLSVRLETPRLVAAGPSLQALGVYLGRVGAVVSAAFPFLVAATPASASSSRPRPVQSPREPATAMLMPEYTYEDDYELKVVSPQLWLTAAGGEEDESDDDTPPPPSPAPRRHMASGSAAGGASGSPAPPARSRAVSRAATPCADRQPATPGAGASFQSLSNTPSPSRAVSPLGPSSTDAVRSKSGTALDGMTGSSSRRESRGPILSSAPMHADKAPIDALLLRCRTLVLSFRARGALSHSRACVSMASARALARGGRRARRGAGPFRVAVTPCIALTVQADGAAVLVAFQAPHLRPALMRPPPSALFRDVSAAARYVLDTPINAARAAVASEGDDATDTVSTAPVLSPLPRELPSPVCLRCDSRAVESDAHIAVGEIDAAISLPQLSVIAVIAASFSAQPASAPPLSTSNRSGSSAASSVSAPSSSAAGSSVAASSRTAPTVQPRAPPASVASGPTNHRGVMQLSDDEGVEPTRMRDEASLRRVSFVTAASPRKTVPDRKASSQFADHPDGGVAAEDEAAAAPPALVAALRSFCGALRLRLAAVRLVVVNTAPGFYVPLLRAEAAPLLLQISGAGLRAVSASVPVGSSDENDKFAAVDAALRYSLRVGVSLSYFNQTIGAWEPCVERLPLALAGSLRGMRVQTTSALRVNVTPSLVQTLARAAHTMRTQWRAPPAKRGRKKRGAGPATDPPAASTAESFPSKDLAGSQSANAESVTLSSGMSAGTSAASLPATASAQSLVAAAKADDDQSSQAFVVRNETGCAIRFWTVDDDDGDDFMEDAGAAKALASSQPRGRSHDSMPARATEVSPGGERSLVLRSYSRARRPGPGGESTERSYRSPAIALSVCLDGDWGAWEPVAAVDIGALIVGTEVGSGLGGAADIAAALSAAAAGSSAATTAEASTPPAGTAGGEGPAVGRFDLIPRRPGAEAPVAEVCCRVEWKGQAGAAGAGAMTLVVSSAMRLRNRLEIPMKVQLIERGRPPNLDQEVPLVHPPARATSHCVDAAVAVGVLFDATLSPGDSVSLPVLSVPTERVLLRVRPVAMRHGLHDDDSDGGDDVNDSVYDWSSQTLRQSYLSMPAYRNGMLTCRPIEGELSGDTFSCRLNVFASRSLAASAPPRRSGRSGAAAAAVAAARRRARTAGAFFTLVLSPPIAVCNRLAASIEFEMCALLYRRGLLVSEGARRAGACVDSATSGAAFESTLERSFASSVPRRPASRVLSAAKTAAEGGRPSCVFVGRVLPGDEVAVHGLDVGVCSNAEVWMRMRIVSSMAAAGDDINTGAEGGGSTFSREWTSPVLVHSTRPTSPFDFAIIHRDDAIAPGAAVRLGGAAVERARFFDVSDIAGRTLRVSLDYSTSLPTRSALPSLPAIADDGGSAGRIFLYTPYWFVNATALPLTFGALQPRAPPSGVASLFAGGPRHLDAIADEDDRMRFVAGQVATRESMQDAQRADAASVREEPGFGADGVGGGGGGVGPRGLLALLHGRDRGGAYGAGSHDDPGDDADLFDNYHSSFDGDKVPAGGPSAVMLAFADEHSAAAESVVDGGGGGRREHAHANRRAAVRLASTPWSAPFSVDSLGTDGELTLVERAPDQKQKDSPAERMFQLGVSVVQHPSALFRRTKLISLHPRFVLVNACACALQFRQLGTRPTHTLLPFHSRTLHRVDGSKPNRICLRLRYYGWQWSGNAYGIALDTIGLVSFRLRNSHTHEMAMLHVYTRLVRSTYEVTILSTTIDDGAAAGEGAIGSALASLSAGLRAPAAETDALSLSLSEYSVAAPPLTSAYVSAASVARSASRAPSGGGSLGGAIATRSLRGGGAPGPAVSHSHASQRSQRGVSSHGSDSLSRSSGSRLHEGDGDIGGAGDGASSIHVSENAYPDAEEVGATLSVAAAAARAAARIGVPRPISVWIPVPYRVENFTLHTLMFHQFGYSSLRQAILPYHTCEYAWDEPFHPRKRLVLDIVSVRGSCVGGWDEYKLEREEQFEQQVAGDGGAGRNGRGHGDSALALGIGPDGCSATGAIRLLPVGEFSLDRISTYDVIAVVDNDAARGRGWRRRWRSPGGAGDSSSHAGGGDSSTRSVAGSPPASPALAAASPRPGVAVAGVGQAGAPGVASMLKVSVYADKGARVICVTNVDVRVATATEASRAPYAVAGAAGAGGSPRPRIHPFDLRVELVGASLTLIAVSAARGPRRRDRWGRRSVGGVQERLLYSSMRPQRVAAASSRRLHRLELLNLSAGGMWARLTQDGTSSTAEIAVAQVQLDNMLPRALHPVVLATKRPAYARGDFFSAPAADFASSTTSAAGSQAGAGVFSARGRTHRPFLHLSVIHSPTLSQPHAGLIYFPYFSIAVQRMDVCVEDQFVSRSLQAVAHLAAVHRAASASSVATSSLARRPDESTRPAAPLYARPGARVLPSYANAYSFVAAPRTASAPVLTLRHIETELLALGFPSSAAAARASSGTSLSRQANARRGGVGHKLNLYFVDFIIHPLRMDITYSSSAAAGSAASDVREPDTAPRLPVQEALVVPRARPAFVEVEEDDDEDDDAETANSSDDRRGVTASNGAGDAPGAGYHPVRVLLRALGVTLANIQRAPLRLQAIHLQEVFASAEELQEQLVRQYTMEGIRQSYMVLGSSDILGNPVGLLSSLASGVSAFFYEPALGLVHSPQAFAGGLAKGTISLVQHSLYGITNTASQFTETITKGLASLVLADDAAGVRGVMGGLVIGIQGLWWLPARGWRERGAQGALLGVFRGVVGVIVLPLAGVFRSAAALSSSVRVLVDPGSASSSERVRGEAREFPRGMLMPLAEPTLELPSLKLLEQERSETPAGAAHPAGSAPPPHSARGRLDGASSVAAAWWKRPND